MLKSQFYHVRIDFLTFGTSWRYMIPPLKISNLTQGIFVGAVTDNFDECIEQKIFHCEIVVDNERVTVETKAYKKTRYLQFRR